MGRSPQLLNWHWIFFINVPVGIATVLLGRAWIAENTGPGVGRDIDALGSVLITAALVVGAYAIVTAGSHGWGSAHTLGFGGARSALTAAFVALEARLANPIMPLHTFRVPGLASSSLVRGLLITGMYAMFFIGALYLEHVRGYGVLTTGLAFLPQTAVMGRAVAGPERDGWWPRFGPRPAGACGASCAPFAGLALFSRVGLAHVLFAADHRIDRCSLGAGGGPCH